MKTYENFNQLEKINKRKQLLKKVEDLAFDADIGFDIFTRWLGLNNLYFGSYMPDIPMKLSTIQMEDFIIYYDKERAKREFNL